MPTLFQLKLIGIALAIVLIFGSGWKVRDAFCDAADAKKSLAAATAREEKLKDQIATMRTAQLNDRKLAEQQSISAKAWESKASELEEKITAGDCFTPEESENIRALWK